MRSPADLRARAVTELTEWTPFSAEQAALRDRFVATLGIEADPFARATAPDHFTAGVLVVSEDRSAVLMNHHRKAGIWVHFGGHLDPGESFLEAATRETREESGLASFTVLPGIAQLSAHHVPFCHPDGTVDHLDVRYLATAPMDQPIVSAESLDVRWWPVGEVPTEEAEMLELIDRAR